MFAKSFTTILEGFFHKPVSVREKCLILCVFHASGSALRLTTLTLAAVLPLGIKFYKRVSIKCIRSVL